MSDESLLRRRSARLGIVVAGILVGQIWLYGDSIFGGKVLLPLDHLGLPGIYLPQTPERKGVAPHNATLSDQVLAFQLEREFASRELRAGRLPLWWPHGYSGAPFAKFAKYSPFNLVFTLFPSPHTMVWIELLKALVAGLGAYTFFRRALPVGFWPACVGAWCYPLTAFLVLWQCFEISMTAVWLPWLLLAVDTVVRRPGPLSGPALAAVSLLTVVSGQLDLAGQLMLASALYALLLLVVDGWGRLRAIETLQKIATLGLAWGIGLTIAAPFVLPLIEYSTSGARMEQRAAGEEERPPGTVAALPEVVLPGFYGSHQAGNLRIVDGNRMEAAPAAYVGLIATLLVAPLAATSRRHRASNVRWLVLALLGISWVVGLPGIVWLLRLPPLNLFSHNRWIFLTAFALLSLAITGLDAVRRGLPAEARRLWPLVVLPAAIHAFCLYRSLHPPEEILELLRRAGEGRSYRGVSGLSDARAILAAFQHHDRMAALIAGAAALGWAFVATGRTRPRLAAPILGLLMLGELAFFARGINPQTDPALYYPRIPVLAEVAAGEPGRIMGLRCLPPRLAASHALLDVRGYDGVDPTRMMDLLESVADPGWRRIAYAPTQTYVPRGHIEPPALVELPPLLDLLGLRYLILRGEPGEGFVPRLAGDDYWVLENREALPRAFVPQRIERVEDAGKRLRLMSDDSFAPRAVAYVEDEIAPLPDPVIGAARIVDEQPTRVTIAVDASTPALVVLADLWDAGWRASLDGRDVEVLRVDHALRGALVPAGRSELVFEYAPASLALGIRLMTGGLLALALWLGLALRSSRASAPPGAGDADATVSFAPAP